MEMYNYIDLFHGIGGFALGAYWAGMKFENHFCSDIEPYCQKLYKLRFPDSIQLGDITKIDTEELKKYGTDWIITGGFPCQDISIAGKGAGITGARSGLWFEYWRLIRDLRPRFAIMENVGMLVHRGLREVLWSLAEIGYDAEWQDIRASDMGAPHRRERIWIVAYPGCQHGAWDEITRQHETENRPKEISDAERISEIGTESENGIGRGFVLGNKRERERQFSTPRKSDAAGASMNRIKAAHGMDGKRHQLREEVYETPDQTIGQLNPQFVAWLMGYPLAWTDTRADLQVSLTRE